MRHSGFLLPLFLLSILPLAAQNGQPIPGQLSGPVTGGIYDLAQTESAIWAIGDHILIRSEDNGSNWTPLPAPPESMHEIEAAADGTLWIATEGGLYSGDGTGGNWTRERDEAFRSLSVADDGSIFAIDPETDRLYRRTTEGESWEDLSPTGQNLRQVVPAPDGMVWLLSETGLEVSINNGTSWTSRGPVPDNSVNSSLLLFSSGDLILIVDDTYYRIRPDVTNWEVLGPTPDDRMVTAATATPGIIIGYEADHGATRSRDTALYSIVGTTTSWEGLPVTEEFDVDLTPRAFLTTGDDRLLMGLSYSDRSWGEPWINIGQILASDDLGESWQVVYTTSLSGSYILKARAFSEENVVTVRYPPSFPHEEEQLLFRTENGGREWAEVTSRAGELHFSTHSIISDATLYMTRGDTNLYRSVDTGRTWEIVDRPATPWLPVGEVFEIDPMNLLVESRVGFSNTTDFASTDGGETWEVRGTRQNDGGVINWTVDGSGTIYLAEQNNIVISRDSGATWTSTEVTGAGSGGNYITGITISREGKPIVVTFQKKLYTTANGGTSWESMAASPGNQLTSITTDPSGNLYVGDRSGTIYRSTDNGETWETFAELPDPASAIRTLSIGDGEAADYLYIGTETQGLWRVSTSGKSDVRERVVPVWLDLW